MKFHVCSLILLIWLSDRVQPQPGQEIISPCAQCSAAKASQENEIPRETLNDVRVELIKEQILMKLRMEEPPRVKRPVLPDVLINGYLLTAEEEQEEMEHNYRGHFSKDDFYGTTQEVVIFPENTSSHNCYTRDELKPSCYFRFRLTKEIPARSITSAELWVHKVGKVIANEVEEMESSNTTVTYTVVEVDPQPTYDGFSKRVVAIEETSVYAGWLKIQFAHVVRTWTSRRHLTYALEISCSGCDLNVESSVSLTNGEKPFIIVRTDSGKYSSKIRRNIACTENSSHCCKKYFKVDFRDINWDNWVIYPMSYVANMCQGSCTTDLLDSRHHHSTITRRYLRKQHSLRANNFNISLCCAGSRMSPLTLIYLDEHNKIWKKEIPNMIIKSCDCT